MQRWIMDSDFNERCAGELRALFDPSRFQNPAAVTLTMKKRVGFQNADHLVASETFRHFMNRLNHTILGSAAKRYGRQLSTVAVIETNGEGRLHYHAIIDRPHYCPFPKFKGAIIDQWQRTDFGYRQIDVQDAADAGWTDYLLKQRQKVSLLNSIDWINCHLNAE
jgi:hypothetical protein